jgi:hypothetical protein
MNAQHLRQPSFSDTKETDQDRHKTRRIDEFPSPSSSLINPSKHVGTPFFFGDFERSRGTEEGHGDSDSGCFGIRIGGSGGSGAQTIKTADEDDDPTALIANAMSNLSLVERERAYEDLHGVSAEVHETPELIVNALHKMEQCFQKIRHKPAYQVAMTCQEGASYVHDPTLRLAFLRADRFDEGKAAERLVGFLDWKLRLFGQEKLCQWHIGLDDLENEAQLMVKSGIDQLLPSRDTRGRAVLVIMANTRIRVSGNTHSTLQFVYYMYQSVAEDEISQKIGLVMVPYTLGQEEGDEKSDYKDAIWKSTKLAFCMPIRIEATHFCLPKTRMHFSMSLVLKGASLFNRARLRAHCGSHLECEYSLLSFGVPTHLLPFTSEGELKMDNHKKWVQRRIVKEDELRRSGVFPGIELPCRNDVLLGKGKPFQKHPGNQLLHELAQIHLEEYNLASRSGGRALVGRKIVNEIWFPPSGPSGRFLQRREDHLNSGWWEVVTDEVVLIEKVCNALRSVRKKTKQLQ